MKIQYVMDKEEYDKLQGKNNKKVQALCTFIANSVPVKFWGNKETKIWGCIHNVTKKNYGYCDECPAQNHCPSEKRWSK